MSDITKERMEIAEQAAQLRYAIATSEDATISYYQNPLYVAASTMLETAIAEAYGAQLALVKRTVGDVIETWVDCGESIAYCVGWVINNANEEAQAQREARAGDWLEAGSETAVDFLRHVRTVTGLTLSSVDEEVAAHNGAVEVLSGAQRCACGSDHMLLRMDNGLTPDPS